MPVRTKLAIGVCAVVAALVVAAATLKAGALPLAALAAGLLGLLLISRPRLAVGLAVGGVILLESEEGWGIPATARLYDFLPGVPVTAAEALLVLAVTAVAVDALQRRSLAWPAPFGGPLALVALAMVAGVTVAASAGVAGNDLIRGVRDILPLLVVPGLVAHVVDTPARLRAALAIVVALGVVKALMGLAVVFGGLAEAELDGTRVTFIESTSNFLVMLVLLGLLAAVLDRVTLPRWPLWAVPLLLACLTLSYRRSFWIAAVLGALLVVVLGSGRVGRRLIVPAVLVAVGLGFVAFTTGAASRIDGPVRDRAASLDPKRVRVNDQDRYRLAERRNVVEEIRRAPLTGIGVSRPWAQRYPLPFANARARTYAHIGILWWWLKMGIVGAAAYVAYMLAAILAGLAIWRRHSDRLVRAAGLGAAMAVVGLAAAEATATFVGAEVRMSTVMGALLGLLAAAWALRDAEPGGGAWALISAHHAERPSPAEH